jgi:AAA ATPase domain
MTTPAVQAEDLTSIFTLRAEDLSEEELEKWTGKVENDEAILARLKGAGAKVLVGPRGSGKSNYLRRAYFELRRQQTSLVAYINFSSHLALEPLMLGNPRALEYFRQWLVYKIIVGVQDAEQDRVDLPADLVELAATGRIFINSLQTRVGVEPDKTPPDVAPSELLELLETWATALGRRRCVLLMDDAAHAFMSQQQREFFELFRALRSRTVACRPPFILA